MRWGEKYFSVLLIVAIGLLAVGCFLVSAYTVSLRAEHRQLVEVLAKEEQLEGVLYAKVIDFERELKQISHDVQIIRLGNCPGKYEMKRNEPRLPIAIQEKKIEKRKGNGGYLTKKDKINS